MYADYEYYRNTYRGKLTEEEYAPLSEFAAAYIDSKTDYLFAEFKVKKSSKNGLFTTKRFYCCAV